MMKSGVDFSVTTPMRCTSEGSRGSACGCSRRMKSISPSRSAQRRLQFCPDEAELVRLCLAPDDGRLPTAEAVADRLAALRP